MEILKRNVEQIITEEEFQKKLRSGNQLRIKHGVDATSTLLHIGHAVNYWKMREFQELGHKVVFLIGDFTTQIGDPTGRSKTRPDIPRKVISENAKRFLNQATKILINKPNLLEVRRNSEWYDKMRLSDFIALLRKVTHARLIERDMFQARIKNNDEIYEHEIVYPVLQAYDSVAIKSDMTIIGTDQLFNELLGRRYQEIFGQKPQTIITTSITPGLDGKEKMSKSLGNFVAISDLPKEKFGKIMTIPDNLIESYLKVYTRLSFQEISEIVKQKPNEAKKRLAYEIVNIYHREKKAKNAKESFEKIFSKREAPEDLKIYRAKSGEKWIDFLVRESLAKSKTEAKRLIAGGGVDFGGEKVANSGEKITKNGTAKIGKYKFIRIAV
ncbi:tyrosine--tRNA ligase [Candidatus Giovannonibacteria bacterium RIFCSPLOWO2_01_FULL_44_40]|uniref:Tyrosine--tRNA ligase n=1 Tax=Candidatus Giovannonibacteria bacterium RIFCSPHIGHO2_01_FULL_45_23 TaxID=1798325 RepID=A0A1F5VI52_9BACT|nr:MAG: tyrosine--tRNA ligase [Candidatus Giovannonibacteria bacterium RIFCSPHIGHO2_01_FULL_45_23]OGF75603.1 MAG: tyrosine--tRNA ligase [Candidatus Giovannonibacteria bacterium RIFCSPHIGHO2_02_FULL_45_13]OGF80110.1 MAG: tyrosine--tRNA ligase [Candidatus Giovannonibacteria bacterium RIFCSPLOWO2_01_FULL_44_40]